MFRQILTALFAAGLLVLSTPSSADDITTGDVKLTAYLSHAGNDRLPPPWTAPGKEIETEQQRRDRIAMIADVTATQAPISAEEHGWRWSANDLALAAFTKMYYESGRFNLLIHQGKVRGDHGHSVCLGQIMNGGNRLVGDDRESTTRCVAEVMRHLILHQRRCLNENTPPSSWAMAKVFAGYGTGFSCSANTWMPKKDEKGNLVKDHWALERAATWWKLRSESLVEPAKEHT